MEEYYAYRRAIGCGPSDNTRCVVLSDPNFSYWYAKYVDRGPRDDTRSASTGNPGCAFQYARYVDKGPREDTRRAVLSEPHYAFDYAILLDLCWHCCTWSASATYARFPMPFEYSLEWLTFEDVPDTVALV